LVGAEPPAPGVDESPVAAGAAGVSRAPDPAPVQASDGSTQRTLGLITAGAGLVGIGVGTFFGIQSMSNNSDAKQECDASGCSPAGVTLRNDAISAGDVSTVSFIAGGVLFAGGVALYLTAPRRPDPSVSASTRRETIHPRSERRPTPPAVRIGIAPQGVFAAGTF
jgi:serine/threonine-protein kinase